MTGLVHLDQQTGEMVVASRIDHEQTDWLNMTVRATDSGLPPRSTFVDVFIQVLDENDNNPYFVGDITNITITEDTPVGWYFKIFLLNFIIIFCCYDYILFNSYHLQYQEKHHMVKSL